MSTKIPPFEDSEWMNFSAKELYEEMVKWRGAFHEAVEHGRNLFASYKNIASSAAALIGDLHDDSPCWYDHHGYCQGHGWMEADIECPHARAKTLLKKTADIQKGTPHEQGNAREDG